MSLGLRVYEAAIRDHRPSAISRLWQSMRDRPRKTELGDQRMRVERRQPPKPVDQPRVPRVSVALWNRSPESSVATVRGLMPARASGRLTWRPPLHLSGVTTNNCEQSIGSSIGHTGLTVTWMNRLTDEAANWSSPWQAAPTRLLLA